MNWWSNLTLYPHPNGWGDQYFCSTCLSTQSIKDYYDEQERKTEEYHERVRAEKAPRTALSAEGAAVFDDLDIEI